MGSTNTTCPLLISLILSAPILYTPFSLNHIGKKLSFDRNIMKTIFHCPVRYIWETLKKKFRHTTVLFMERITRGIFL